MKRLYLWLRELSLSQQLLTITFLIVSVFTVFIFTFLSPKIDSFTEASMYKILHATQESTVYYLEMYGGDLPTYDSDNHYSVVEAVYHRNADTFEVYGGLELSEEEMGNIRLIVSGGLSDTMDFRMRVSVTNETILCSIVPVDNDTYLFSKIPATFEDTFRRELMGNVINANILVAWLLFLLLMFWVATLIHPLNQIKLYITRIKNDEPAVLTVNRRDEIGQVADALRDMDEELKKQNEQKQEMIQNISHDLKTPIATIRSYGESIKDGIYPYGTLEGSVDVIIEHAERLEKKVYQLIALNKMGYLQDDCPEGDTVEMSKVIDKVLLSLKVMRPEVTFEKVVDPQVMFHGMEDPWRIVVENLVDNSLRYAESYIRLEVHPGELKVINDGNPINPEKLETIFKPYEKGNDGKFGLGLSIVYKVASTYGYHVAAENLEKGVCFRIWKDLSKAEKKALEKGQKV